MRPGIFILLLAVACSTGSPPSSSAGNTLDHPSARHAGDLITAEELAGLRARNVCDATTQLRPSFLQPHRSASPSDQLVHAMVYIDDTSLADGLDALRHIRPDDVV